MLQFKMSGNVAAAPTATTLHTYYMSLDQASSKVSDEIYVFKF